MSELGRLLARLPGAFRDELPRHLRVDLDDLKSWLHVKHLTSYLLEEEGSESIGALSSHSSPASKFAILQMALPTVYSAADTDRDPSLASMLSVVKAPLDLLESQSQTPLNDYFASVEQSHRDVPLMTPHKIDCAGEEWPWVPSGTVRLADDVSSDVHVPSEPFPVTQNCSIELVERFHGIPSQKPVCHVSTTYIIDFSSARDKHKDKHGNTTRMNLQLILKDRDWHSWDGTQEERQLAGRDFQTNSSGVVGVRQKSKIQHIDNPDVGQYNDTVEAVVDSAASSSRAVTFHKVVSAESSGVLDSKKRMRRKAKPWGVVHDDQKYASFEFLAQVPDEYRSL
ncbi:hypothetical protein C8R45DRAFT_1115531 [Mycena sanguinolenta]|nr:hypothetical protein C8R45DRAFT_1115531 [Mycena sanguinolenta]